MITILPEAKAHFDEKVNSLFDELIPLKIEAQPKPLSGSSAHRPVTTLKDTDIIQFKDHHYIDGLGRFCGFKIHEDDIAEFLPRDAAEKLERIIERVYKLSNLEVYCSKTYIRDHLVDWMRRIRLQKTADKSWITDLLAHLNKDVCDQTILVPLEGIQITIPFSLGNVTFQYFTKSMVDSILRNIKDDSLYKEIFCENFKKQYQGRVYTEFQCKAERLHAQTLASIHTDKALELLKFFSPAALEIRAQCFLGRKGQVNPGQWSYFVE